MRLRTFILLILVLIVGAAAVFLVIANTGSSSRSSFGLAGNTAGTEAASTGVDAPSTAEEPNQPPPPPTPSVRFESVVVAKAAIPVGTRITRDLLDVQERPDTNIALVGAVTFADPEEIVGRIAGVDIAKGQEILNPMLALNASDLASFGSDLAININQGHVAVAFPIDKFSGAAFAMRPGDLVDVLMTLRIVAIDPEFRTALPNLVQYVIEPDLRQGGSFLLPDITPQGRLEFIEEIGQVAEIVPSDLFLPGQDFAPGSPIPKRVTQLTVQQAEVLWVGTWKNQDELAAATAENTDTSTDPELAPSEQGTEEPTGEEAPAAETTAEETTRESAMCLNSDTGLLVPCPVIRAKRGTPDVVILGMSSQDALALKYALERGIDIDLALRAQGDTTPFVTASVTLPQIVEQGGLSVPPPADFDLHPRPEEIPAPAVPAIPPED